MRALLLALLFLSLVRAAAAGGGVADEVRAFNAPREANLALLQEKLRRLAGSPWTFMRGTAHLFYRRLAADPAALRAFVTPATGAVVVHGDLHLQNCGTFEDANGKVRYDLQDFDDATRAPYVVDVVRAATSVLVMAREVRVGAAEAREAAQELLEEYADAVADVAAGKMDPDFAFKEDDAKGPVAKLLDRAKKVSRKDHLKRRTEGGSLRRDDRHFDVPAMLSRAIARALKPRAVVDVVRKKSNGCGSLGLDDFLVLTDDDVILELKEQGPLSLAPYVKAIGGAAPPALAADPAARAVAAQRALQSNPDRHADAVRVDGKSFLVREDSPHKDALAAEEIENAKDLRQAARAVGRLAAKAHARQGAKMPAKLSEAIGDKKAFARALLEVAQEQAKGVFADHEEYTRSPLARGQW